MRPFCSYWFRPFVWPVCSLREVFDVVQYGDLSYAGGVEHPLFAVKTRGWSAEKPSVLVTGGVHGYETSGVQRC